MTAEQISRSRLARSFPTTSAPCSQLRSDAENRREVSSALGGFATGLGQERVRHEYSKAGNTVVAVISGDRDCSLTLTVLESASWLQAAGSVVIRDLTAADWAQFTRGMPDADRVLGCR